MAEINNSDIFKSIVQATDNDPVFQQLVLEYVRPNVDTDTSPDEDLDARHETKFIERCVNKQKNLTVKHSVHISINFDLKLQRKAAKAE